MSDDNKDLRDDLEDLLGDAKEGVRKAAGKAEEFGKEAKEKANEFAKEAKEKAGEFAGEAKKILSEGKNIAIISHLTIIGWIIALIMNNPKTDLGSFYIRQMLGLGLTAILFSWVPIIGWILGLMMFLFWVMSLFGALSGQKKITPILGQYYQDWFKSL